MWNGTNLKPLGTTRLKVKNPKTHKKYSIEFVVVPDNLMPLIGACRAQQKELITVHQDNFVAVPPPWRQMREANLLFFPFLNKSLLFSMA